MENIILYTILIIPLLAAYVFMGYGLFQNLRWRWLRMCAIFFWPAAAFFLFFIYSPIWAIHNAFLPEDKRYSLEMHISDILNP